MVNHIDVFECDWLIVEEVGGIVNHGTVFNGCSVSNVTVVSVVVRSSFLSQMRACYYVHFHVQ
jgi:hypothetical protein